VLDLRNCCASIPQKLNNWLTNLNILQCLFTLYQQAVQTATYPTVPRPTTYAEAVQMPSLVPGASSPTTPAATTGDVNVSVIIC